MDIFTEEHIKKIYSSRTKNSVLTSILNLYCSATYLNRNLWMLESIHDTFQNIEKNSGKTADIIYLINKLVTLMNKNKKRELRIYPENMQYMLYTTISCDPQIGFIKELVTESTYSFLNILYVNIRDSLDLQQSFSITANILKETNSKSKELDSYDCMFIFLLQMPKLIVLEKNVEKYITTCKDLFYYRLRKKDRYYRENLIYFCVYILIKKQVTYKEISGNSHDYLFIYPKCDDTIKVIKDKPKKLETKQINVIETHSKQNLKIILE
jgi:hypothetical protein